MDTYAATINGHVIFFVYAGNLDEAYDIAEIRMERPEFIAMRENWKNYGLIEIWTGVQS